MDDIDLPQQEYRVTWSIDLQATGPEDAAKQAWAMLDDATRSNSGASVLAVAEGSVVVHLDMEDDPPRIVSIAGL